MLVFKRVFGVGLFLLTILTATVYAEDKSAGFYAGPLSAVAETVVVSQAKVKRFKETSHPLVVDESAALFKNDGTAEKNSEAREGLTEEINEELSDITDHDVNVEL